MESAGSSQDLSVGLWVAVPARIGRGSRASLTRVRRVPSQRPVDPHARVRPVVGKEVCGLGADTTVVTGEYSQALIAAERNVDRDAVDHCDVLDRCR